MLKSYTVKPLKLNEWENEYVFGNLYPRNTCNSLPIRMHKRENGIIRQKHIQIYHKSERRTDS
jgi:hypothetical protein